MGVYTDKKGKMCKITIREVIWKTYWFTWNFNVETIEFLSLSTAKYVLDCFGIPYNIRKLIVVI